MANYIRDDIDWDAYAESTEGAHKVHPASSFTDEVIRHFHDDTIPQGAYLPFRKAKNLLRFREAEVTVWTGINGHGKSLVLGQAITGLVAQREPTCIASLEMKPVKTLARMQRQASGVRRPDPNFIREFGAWTDNYLWLYDQVGTVRSERLLALIRYTATQMGMKHFVLDSLMKSGVPEDGPTANQMQKEFVNELCTIAQDTGIHIHLVAHSKKQRDELGMPGKMDVSGSGAITNQPDNLITVWRNKAKERAIEAGDAYDLSNPDAVLLCEKQRNGDWEGRINLWLDKESLQYVEWRDGPPIDLLKLCQPKVTERQPEFEEF